MVGYHISIKNFQDFQNFRLSKFLDFQNSQIFLSFSKFLDFQKGQTNLKKSVKIRNFLFSVHKKFPGTQNNSREFSETRFSENSRELPGINPSGFPGMFTTE